MYPCIKPLSNSPLYVEPSANTCTFEQSNSVRLLRAAHTSPQIHLRRKPRVSLPHSPTKSLFPHAQNVPENTTVPEKAGTVPENQKPSGPSKQWPASEGLCNVYTWVRVQGLLLRVEGRG